MSTSPGTRDLPPAAAELTSGERRIPHELLTADEHAAIDMAGDLFTLLSRVVGNGGTRADDLAEFRDSIHHIQHAVMAQAAARAYPNRYRLLGGTVDA